VQSHPTTDDADRGLAGADSLASKRQSVRAALPARQAGSTAASRQGARPARAAQQHHTHDWSWLLLLISVWSTVVAPLMLRSRSFRAPGRGLVAGVPKRQREARQGREKVYRIFNK
jgi:hypothetical protein